MPWMGAGCCQSACLFVEDSFDRADNDDPGPNWEEIVTDSDIDGNMLKQTAGALALHTFRPKNGYVWVEIEMTDMAVDGKIFRVIVGYEDSSNYYWAECEIAAGSNWDLTLRLGQTQSGVESTLKESAYLGQTSVGSTWPLRVCFSSGEFMAWIRDQQYYVWQDGPLVSASGLNPIAGPWRTGLASAGGTIKWDRFTAWEHWDAKRICPKCGCRCGTSLLPNGPLDVEIISEDSGASSSGGVGAGNCSCLNGQYAMAIETVGACDLSNDCVTWKGDTPSHCNGRIEWRIRLRCPNSTDLADFRLWVNHPAVDSPGGAWLDPIVELSACDPLYLVYESDTLSLGVICDGYVPHDPPLPITFIVTE